jgi:hypothetical protein
MQTVWRRLLPLPFANMRTAVHVQHLARYPALAANVHRSAFRRLPRNADDLLFAPGDFEGKTGVSPNRR